MFRSTLPRRERRARCPRPRSPSGFDPRSREGSDVPDSNQSCRATVFRSTLPRRERHALPDELGERVEFRSTLPRRERRGTCRVRPSAPCFDPRSREGSDDNIASGYTRLKVSIHAPAKGATRRGGREWLGGWQFRSTLPRRERRGRGPAACPGSSFDPRSREGSDPPSCSTPSR